MIEVSEVLHIGPNCHQALITISGDMERDHGRMISFESFLRAIGVNIDWRDNSGIKIKIKVFLDPQHSEKQRKQILNFLK